MEILSYETADVGPVAAKSKAGPARPKGLAKQVAKTNMAGPMVKKSIAKTTNPSKHR